VFIYFLCDSLQAMLHFIYRDTLTEDVDMATSTSSPVCSVTETLTTKLLAAAEVWPGQTQTGVRVSSLQGYICEFCFQHPCLG